MALTSHEGASDLECHAYDLEDGDVVMIEVVKHIEIRYCRRKNGIDSFSYSCRHVVIHPFTRVYQKLGASVVQAQVFAGLLKGEYIPGTPPIGDQIRRIPVERLIPRPQTNRSSILNKHPLSEPVHPTTTPIRPHILKRLSLTTHLKMPPPRAALNQINRTDTTIRRLRT
ncbi:Uncharacterised protein [Propionibacterium australiense]|uniref:Uncharacterized protein n=1 Tax=Propionibacterium australiense TaxID=119981 RepID=A0A383S9X1_9ACTN|nr:hypothetical protein D9T14_12395 [Propionibacterium australiense]SYZ34531.1 Hypothetical protein PROPAUS_2548 [Propionibacterium australiense]VEH89804.1 Uncharacterised protein [Propionibacterium australiense]